MSSGAEDEVHKVIGWHIKAILAYLAEIRQDKSALAARMHLVLAVDDHNHGHERMRIELLPNHPGFDKLERELGLAPGAPEDGRAGSGDGE
jgi:hypothetical protein